MKNNKLILAFGLLGSLALASCSGTTASGGTTPLTPPPPPITSSLTFEHTNLDLAVGASTTDKITLNTNDVGHNVALSFSIQGNNAGDHSPVITPNSCDLTTGNINTSSCTITIDATNPNTTTDTYMITTTVTYPDQHTQQSTQQIAVVVTANVTPVESGTISEAASTISVAAGESYVNGAFLTLSSENSVGRSLTVAFVVSGGGAQQPVVSTQSQDGAAGCTLITGDPNHSTCSISVDATQASVSDTYVVTPTVTMPDGHTTKQLPAILVKVTQPLETFSVTSPNLTVAPGITNTTESLTMAVNSAPSGQTVVVTLPAVAGAPGITVTNVSDNSSVCNLSTTAGAAQTCGLKITVGGTVTAGIYTFTPTVAMPDGTSESLTQATITIGVNTTPPVAFKEESNLAAITAGKTTAGAVKMFELDGNGVDTGTTYTVTFNQPTGTGTAPIIAAGSNVTLAAGTFTCSLTTDGTTTPQFCTVTADATTATIGGYTIAAPTFTAGGSGALDPIVITVNPAPATVALNTTGSGRLMAWESTAATLSLIATGDVGTLVYDLSESSESGGAANPVTITNSVDGSTKCSLTTESPTCTVNIKGSSAGLAQVIATPEADAPTVRSSVPVTVNDLFAGNDVGNIFNSNGMVMQKLGDHVSSNIVDSNNQLWAGTTNLFMNSNPFAGGIFAQYAGYTTDGGHIYAIAEDSNGNMYAGTDCNGSCTVYELAKGSDTWQVAGTATGPIKKNNRPSLDGSNITQMVIDSNNNVYAITAAGNLWELVGGQGTWTTLIAAGSPVGTTKCTACKAYSMTTSGTKLYVGSASNSFSVLLYDGTTWSDVNGGLLVAANNYLYQIRVDNADNIYVVGNNGNNKGDVFYLPANSPANTPWVGIQADGTGVADGNYGSFTVIDPISGHLYMTTHGSAAAGYGNIYDCDGAAATCTVIPNFGGNTIDRTSANSLIISLSMTHF